MNCSKRQPRVAGLVALAAGLMTSAVATPVVIEDRPTAKRELSTDRPDATESPFTVEPGFMQLEMEFANYERDREGGAKVTAWEAAPFNLRVGVTAATEVGVFVVPYRAEIETAPGLPRQRRRGFGDVTLRGKMNIQGNDGGHALAYGLIADVKLPTGARAVSNRKVEGALAVPFAFELAAGWSAGGMTSAERVYNESERYRTVWSNTFTVGRDLTERVGGFVELTSSTGDGRHVSTLDVGATFEVNRNAQLDCGVNFGLSRRAPDVQVFAGWAQRF